MCPNASQSPYRAKSESPVSDHSTNRNNNKSSDSNKNYYEGAKIDERSSYREESSLKLNTSFTTKVADEYQDHIKQQREDSIRAINECYNSLERSQQNSFDASRYSPPREQFSNEDKLRAEERGINLDVQAEKRDSIERSLDKIATTRTSAGFYSATNNLMDHMLEHLKR